MANNKSKKKAINWFNNIIKEFYANNSFVVQIPHSILIANYILVSDNVPYSSKNVFQLKDEDGSIKSYNTYDDCINDFLSTYDSNNISEDIENIISKYSLNLYDLPVIPYTKEESKDEKTNTIAEDLDNIMSKYNIKVNESSDNNTDEVIEVEEVLAVDKKNKEDKPIKKKTKFINRKHFKPGSKVLFKGGIIYRNSTITSSSIVVQKECDAYIIDGVIKNNRIMISQNPNTRGLGWVEVDSIIG